MAVVIGRRVRFGKDFLRKNGADISEMKRELTIEGTKLSDYGSRDPLVCYSESVDHILVPKMYGAKLIKRKAYDFTRRDHAGESIRVSFSGRLRDAQVAAVRDTIRCLRETEGAVMNMYCGFGKTTCCNYITCDLKMKTLVLVHSSSLVEQWRQRIEQFVQGSSVGLIRQNVFDVEGKTHVIGLMQSICRRDYGKEAFNSFGLTVVDECHHVCAEQLSKCLERAGSRFRLGLSATPFRKDGFTPFLFHAMGDISCTVERDSTTQEIDVHAVHLEAGPRQVHYIRRAGKQSVNIARMISDIADHDRRTDYLVDCVHTHASNARQVMVLSDRRLHLQRMHERLTERQLESPYAMSFMVGGIGPDALCVAERARVIFATYAYASEGVDVPSLDTVVFATPRVDVVQTTGRILRKHGGKQKPLVVDFIDVFSLFQNQFSKRLRYYGKLGANVTHMDQALKVQVARGARAAKSAAACGFLGSVFD